MRSTVRLYLIFCLPVVYQDEPVREFENALQGEWKIVMIESRGRRANPNLDLSTSFSKGRFDRLYKGKVVTSGRYSLEKAGDHFNLDFSVDDNEGSGTIRTIVKFKDSKLILAESLSRSSRPSSFRTDEDDFVITTFEKRSAHP
jgi:uncharacterized protein (TIGR03067 family)